ncbi:MAG: aminotransferase class V-fold PLP-dependent enzyme [Amaricoccus sp.]|uniref:aminotransferase class V-fold PLP-dependent enzyme n=1 Tax=Amaricoccus sp. TaxID=1872485 RepID=UPI003315F29D
MPELDIDFVRAQFPAFEEPSLAGQAFFENAGGSYACRQVIDRLNRAYVARKVQPYAPYAASRIAGEGMDEARARLAALMGVETDEVMFGPSTSQNTYVLAQAFRDWLRPGDAVVVTGQDHEANSGVWRRLENAGIEIREWAVDPVSGHLDPADLAGLLDERVRLVCFPHCSNIVGEINPVAEIVAMAHAVGAVTCVDGVSFAPHGLPDVAALGTDIYLFSTYKTYGPHQGVMVVRRALADALPNQGHFFNAEAPAKRLTPAGPDHAQVAACAGIVDYIDAVHAHHHTDEAPPVERARRVLALQSAREARLLAPLLDYLRGRNDARLIGPDRPEGRVPTVALHLARPGAEVAAALVPHGIMASGGDFYAVRLLGGLGIDPAHGVLRVSFVHYTSEDEINQLVRALDAVL